MGMEFETGLLAGFAIVCWIVVIYVCIMVYLGLM